MSADHSSTNAEQSVAIRFRTISGDHAVEQVVSTLNAICKQATLDFAFRVGEVVVGAFYAGDLKLWRKRGPKTASFRKLARHPKLSMSPAALYRSVAIYEMCERLGARDWKHVSATHMRAVLGVPEEQQRAWLETAEHRAWPARRLEEEITLQHARTEIRGGRKARHPLSKTIRTLEGCLDGQHRLIGADVAGLDPSPESARRILETLHQLQSACASLENQMCRYVVGRDS